MVKVGNKALVFPDSYLITIAYKSANLIFSV